MWYFSLWEKKPKIPKNIPPFAFAALFLAGAHPVVVAMVDHDFTKFIWHGELFHYGFSSEGLWVIAETDDPGPEDWGIATRDPREETGVDISKIKWMSDAELAHQMAWRYLSRSLTSKFG